MDTLLTNMKMSTEEAKEEMQPTAADAPEYPWGLSITLNDDSLEKLGMLKSLPAVNTKMVLTAEVVVSSVRSYQTQAGEDESSIDLQITDMKLANSGTESMTNASNTLYGKG